MNALKAFKTPLVIGLALTLHALPSQANNFGGHPDRTATPTAFEVKKTFIYDYKVNGPRDYIIEFNSCQSIIEEYYDQVEVCSNDLDCGTFPPFPSNTQTVLRAFDKSRWADDDSMSNSYYLAKSATVQCKFEARELDRRQRGPALFPASRTEKGWTPVEIITSQTGIDKNLNVINPKNITAVTAALSSPDSNTGVWMCGNDGVSGISNANYPIAGYLSSNTPVMQGGNTFIDSLSYRIGKQFIDRPFNVWKQGSKEGYKSEILKGFIGELHPQSAMIAGECNSACTDPAWEVYALNSANQTLKLTKGASKKGEWAVTAYQEFKNQKDYFLPSAVLFSLEAVKESSYDFLPGGSYFGYKSNVIYAR